MQLVKASRDALLKPLQVVSGIVERRQTLPILANILVRKDGERVSFTAVRIGFPFYTLGIVLGVLAVVFLPFFGGTWLADRLGQPLVAVALGDVADIEVDALPGRKLSGRVYEIANSAKSANGQAQAQSQTQKTEFLVKVAIAEPPEELRPGMTAAADIVTDTKDAALSVPVQCVTVRTLEQLKGDDKGEGKGKQEAAGVPAANADDGAGGFKADEDGFVQIVFVLEDGKAVARQVETGLQGENLLEITSGLKAGETVISGGYRAISRDLKNGARVEVNNEAKDKAEKA